MILTKENQKWLSEVVDQSLKLKSILELIDGYVARILISVIDTTACSKLTVPGELKISLNLLVEQAKNKDLYGLEKTTARIVNSYIDLPELDEEAEALIFEGAIKILVGAVKAWVKK